MLLFILLTGILELLVGLLMLVKPGLIPQFAKSDATAIGLARMYGAAATAIGVLALLVAKDIEQTVLHEPFLIMFFVFHLLVALAVFITVKAGGRADVKVAILHTVLAVITGYFLLGLI